MMNSTGSTFVGVGGWAYFPSKQGNKLALCARLFDYAEVNSTFYKLPPEKLAAKWRSTVPEEFQFSVRANRKLTHINHLEPTRENFSEYERNLSICRALRAFILHFQFPPSFDVTREVVESWRGFFSSLKREREMSFAIEVRNRKASESPLLKSFLNDYDIVPSSDPTRSEIGVSRDSKIQYSRVFGLGEHTKWSFSTRELEELIQKVSKTPAARKYMTFHNITMYEDGARLMRMLKQEGNEPLSPVVGIASLKEAVVAERIDFPISNRELSSRLAWRTVTAVDGRRIHADEIMGHLPGDVRFESLQQVLDRYESSFQSSDFGRGV